MADEHASPKGRSGMDSTRVTAFSDGLFVVAATLLVVSIDIPNVHGDAALRHALDDITPQVVSYFVSFAVIVLFWFRHHELFGRVHSHDTRFVLINMVFLSFIAVLPFPTELVGKYGDETISVVIYAINVLILSGLLTALFVYSERRGLVHADPVYGRHRVRAISVVVVFGASIPVAYVFGARPAMYLWLSLLFVPRIIARLTGGRYD
jgi:uncharacterized membrane protein